MSQPEATPLTTKALAAALGVSVQRVGVLRREGMPMDSVEAAVAWREAKAAERSASAPVPTEQTSLDDGTIQQRIFRQNILVSRARDVWQAAMETGDRDQAKYHTQYNQATAKLIDLEAEAERRSLMAREYIKSSEAKEAMLHLTGEWIEMMERMPSECGEACNPNDPPKAIAVLQAYVRKVREKLSGGGAS
jgi:hypothetical protein